MMCTELTIRCIEGFIQSWRSFQNKWPFRINSIWFGSADYRNYAGGPENGCSWLGLKKQGSDWVDTSTSSKVV